MEVQRMRCINYKLEVIKVDVTERGKSLKIMLHIFSSNEHKMNSLLNYTQFIGDN